MSGLEIGFFSIPVDDLNRAKAFYGEVMGWSFQERDPDFIYVMSGENIIGALEQARPGFQPSGMGPLMYFRADGMGSTLERVGHFGGTVLEKTAIQNGERGYTARVHDPFENSIAFWAPQD